jgi:hypothetical protein
LQGLSLGAPIRCPRQLTKQSRARPRLTATLPPYAPLGKAGGGQALFSGTKKVPDPLLAPRP